MRSTIRQRSGWICSGFIATLRVHARARIWPAANRAEWSGARLSAPGHHVANAVARHHSLKAAIGRRKPERRAQLSQDAAMSVVRLDWQRFFHLHHWLA